MNLDLQTVVNAVVVGLLGLALGWLAKLANAAAAQPVDPALIDPRCCVTPVRNADGSIRRRADVLRAFRKLYPCPSTSQYTGACAGWAIDHVVPLICGGVDAVGNAQWLPNAIKTCAASTGVPCKDRWERTVYRTVIAC